MLSSTSQLLTRPFEDGHAVAFDPLFERYHRYVAGIAVRLMGRDDSDVDDVVQDVFLLASRRLAKLSDMASAKGWLAVVTTRVVRRKLLKRRFREGPLRALLWPGFLVQKITTAEPEDAQLEVALASLRATLWREEALTAPAPADRTFAGYGELIADPGYARA